MSLFAFVCPGPTELVIIAIVLMLLFGPTMLPKAARSLGSVIPSFRSGLKDAKTEVEDAAKALEDAVNGDKK